MKRLIARPALGVPGVKRAQVEADADEVRKASIGQPVLQLFGQQSLLLRLVGEVACGHAHNLPSIRSHIAILPRRLLALKDALQRKLYLVSHGIIHHALFNEHTE